ncbi:MAG: hypothetical protein L6R48_11990, partial [Planctomycetes bacterium]|nr:hypothetical protein [Planctomycetota bacterium]
AGCSRDCEEWQRVLADATLARADAEGAGAALDQLAAHEADLGADLRLMAVRLALAAGRADEALRRSEAIPGRPAALLAVRARIARRDIPAAATAAATLQQAEPGDEEAALLLAECRAAEGRFAEALAIATAAALPRRPGVERVLLLAAIELELNGEAACAARLALLDQPDHGIPLVRVFAAAWPRMPLEPDPARPMRRQDVEHLPGFPGAACRLAAALVRNGEAAAAARYLVLVAEQLPNPARHRRRRVWWQAGNAFRAAGDWSRAMGCWFKALG